MKISYKVTVNGKEYNNQDDVPAELRGLLEDQDGNGIPDFMENALQGQSSMKITATTQVFNFNGKEYSSIEEMPPEAQAAMRDLKLGGRFKSAAAPAPRPSPRPAPPLEAGADDYLDPDHRGMKAIEPTSGSSLGRWLKRIFGGK